LANYSSAILNYPERVIQFGEGNFLRAFVDWMIHRMNKSGVFQGRVVVVQPKFFRDNWKDYETQKLTVTQLVSNVSGRFWPEIGVEAPELVTAVAAWLTEIIASGVPACLDKVS
jgi:hypothetical protein